MVTRIIENDLLVNMRTKPHLATLKKTPRIIDIGSCVRPCPVFRCEEHICIEPHGEYCDVLRSDWKPNGQKVTVVQAEAEEVANYPREGSTVLLIDVIEHMEKERGKKVRDLLQEFEQALIFTPLGFMPLDGGNPDSWGYNGGYWQQHRSGWLPQDFTGWQKTIWPEFHKWLTPHFGAILAIWRK